MNIAVVELDTSKESPSVGSRAMRARMPRAGVEGVFAAGKRRKSAARIEREVQQAEDVLHHLEEKTTSWEEAKGELGISR